MKKYQLLAACIMFALNSSVVTAGAISDAYTKGDVLTASKLDNIKAAVNDNNNASRFYGDGSAGPLTISANTDWNATSPAGDNLNFTDVVIDAGAMLTVPAGTIIRCSGSFTNNGTIKVADVDNRGRLGIGAGKGDARKTSTEGMLGTSLGLGLNGGLGGKGIPRAVAASSFNHFTTGGGAGSDSLGSSPSINYSSGGGLVKIYCQNNISNSGVIAANGIDSAASDRTYSGGGGGGGIVILASSASITNTGLIYAKGGNGSSAISNGAGASGGGGGGIIIFVAPVVSTNNNTLFVDAGASGTGAITITSQYHQAGSGGGASGGDGGIGGDISTTNIAQSPGGAWSGYILQIQASPAGMM